jgi:hypothetical protein
MKRLITLISTKGKSPERVHRELEDNLKKYREAEGKAADEMREEKK